MILRNPEDTVNRFTAHPLNAGKVQYDRTIYLGEGNDLGAIAKRAIDAAETNYPAGVVVRDHIVKREFLVVRRLNSNPGSESAPSNR
jgi:hypothetical protein